MKVREPCVPYMPDVGHDAIHGEAGGDHAPEFVGVACDVEEAV